MPVALSPQPARPQRRALPYGGGKGRLRQLLQAVLRGAAGAGRGPAGRAAPDGAGVRAGEGRAECLDWGHVGHVSPLPGKGVLARGHCPSTPQDRRRPVGLGASSAAMAVMHSHFSPRNCPFINDLYKPNKSKVLGALIPSLAVCYSD